MNILSSYSSWLLTKKVVPEWIVYHLTSCGISPGLFGLVKDFDHKRTWGVCTKIAQSKCSTLCIYFAYIYGFVLVHAALPTLLCCTSSPTLLGRDHHTHWVIFSFSQKNKNLLDIVLVSCNSSCMGAGEHGKFQKLNDNIWKLSMAIITRQMPAELHFAD